MDCVLSKQRREHIIIRLLASAVYYCFGVTSHASPYIIIAGVWKQDSGCSVLLFTKIRELWNWKTNFCFVVCLEKVCAFRRGGGGGGRMTYYTIIMLQL